VQSVETALQIVSLLGRHAAPRQLTEIAQEAGLGLSATHRHLSSLVRSGLLCQQQSHRYAFGPLAVQIGFSALLQQDRVEVTSAAVREFVSASGATAMLSLWSAQGPLVIRWIQGRRPVFTSIAVGTVMPLQDSATGRVFLAYEEDALLEAAGVDLSAARDLRASVRRDGLARVAGDLVPGLAAVAVPVFDGLGSLAAVITTVSAAADIDADTVSQLLEAAKSASAALGQTGAEAGSRP
jgi:DNA-binding IclR family transcriptional regulator